MVTVFNQDQLEYSLEIARFLRESGLLSVEVCPQIGDLGKQLKIAAAKQIDDVIIIGEDEQREQKVTVKNLNTGEQQTMTMRELNEYFI